MGDLKSVIEDGGSIVAGAGAAELEVSKNLRDFATGLEGREQLAVNAFADALEVVPKTLEVYIHLKGLHPPRFFLSGALPLVQQV